VHRGNSCLPRDIHHRSTAMSHDPQKNSTPCFEWITLKPSGTRSTCMSREYSFTSESRATPVFRQLGHLRYSTQWSRARTIP
jgi:hypothetical protein